MEKIAHRIMDMWEGGDVDEALKLMKGELASERKVDGRLGWVHSFSDGSKLAGSLHVDEFERVWELVGELDRYCKVRGDLDRLWDFLGVSWSPAKWFVDVEWTALDDLMMGE